MLEQLPGEGETKLIRKTKTRRECDNCGSPAFYRNTYLNDGQSGARRNPASSAYGRDDCTWCSDHDQYLCGECQASKHQIGVPDGYGWCATFQADRLPHMFLRWEEEEVEPT